MAIIGIDFDNTIVRYDEVFHQVARETGLIPDNIPVKKEAVRDYLRSVGKEDDWTALQGLVYGARMHLARAFDGVMEFISRAIRSGHTIYIISHKTRYPFLGEKYDLHESARNWLKEQGFFQAVGMHEDQAFFELTKEAKIQRIISQGCEIFIDDLPEILDHPLFPQKVRKFLFSESAAETYPNFEILKSWLGDTAQKLSAPG